MQFWGSKNGVFSSNCRGRPPCLPEKNERGIRWQSGQKKTDVRRQKSDEGHSQAVRGCVKIRIMDEKSLPVVPSSWEEGLGVVENNNDITYYKSYVYEMVEPFLSLPPLPPPSRRRGLQNDFLLNFDTPLHGWFAYRMVFTASSMPFS